LQPAGETLTTGGTGITILPPLPDISNAEYDADYESDDSLDLGVTKGKASISLKQTEFSM
jgi:hypothetical protein